MKDKDCSNCGNNLQIHGREGGTKLEQDGMILYLCGETCIQTAKDTISGYHYLKKYSYDT